MNSRHRFREDPSTGNVVDEHGRVWLRGEHLEDASPSPVAPVAEQQMSTDDGSKTLLAAAVGFLLGGWFFD